MTERKTNPPPVSGSQLANSKAARSFVVAFGLALLLGAGLAHACTIPHSQTTNLLQSGSEWNVIEMAYHPELETMVVVDYWHDPEAELYEAQFGDIVIADDDGIIQGVFIDTTQSGGGGDDGGGYLPPTIIQGSRGETRSYDEFNLMCSGGLPFPEVEDRISAIGNSLKSNFGFIRIFFFGRSSFGGGDSGGGGGVGPTLGRAPGLPINNPPAQHESECTAAPEARADHARSAFGVYRASMSPIQFNNRVQPGTVVSIRYSGGGSESYTVIAPNSTYPLSQLPDTLVCP